MCFHIFPIHRGFRIQIPPCAVTKSDCNWLFRLCRGRRHALPAMRQTRQSSWTAPLGHVYTGFSQCGSQVGSLAQKAMLAQIPMQLYQQNCGVSSQLVANKAANLFPLSWRILAAGNLRKKKTPQTKTPNKNQTNSYSTFSVFKVQGLQQQLGSLLQSFLQLSCLVDLNHHHQGSGNWGAALFNILFPSLSTEGGFVLCCPSLSVAPLYALCWCSPQ